MEKSERTQKLAESELRGFVTRAGFSLSGSCERDARLSRPHKQTTCSTLSVDSALEKRAKGIHYSDGRVPTSLSKANLLRGVLLNSAHTGYQVPETMGTRTLLFRAIKKILGRIAWAALT
jgi:hypothetical protein